jgi:hypothetical protein
MVEPIALAALFVAAVSPLYNILKRHYDLKNANLQSRVELARELKNACEQWSSLLENTFDRAVALLSDRGPNAARSEVERQQNDFNALDYGALIYDSEALNGLRQDPQFHEFADACGRFYAGAIEVKRIAYDTFDDAGTSRRLDQDGVAIVAHLWKRQVDDLLNVVRSRFRAVEGTRQS